MLKTALRTPIRIFSRNMSSSFVDAVVQRRSHYAIEKCPEIGDQKIMDVVNTCIKYCPSAFNSQTSRVLCLFGKDHEELWGDIVKSILTPVTPEEAREGMFKKMDGFKNAHGTILFFEDRKAVQELQASCPAQFKGLVPDWSSHAHGINSYAVWTALDQDLGLGCNLQHYNPLVDSTIIGRWDLPADWALCGQLVFGSKKDTPKEKTFKPLEGERVRVAGMAK